MDGRFPLAAAAATATAKGENARDACTFHIVGGDSGWLWGRYVE